MEDQYERSAKNGNKGGFMDKMCIGITLQSLDLRTCEAIDLNTVNKIGQGYYTSDEDQEEVKSPAKPKSKLESAKTETKKESSKKEKNVFFDRTAKENRGVPLFREFRLKGFAVYIDSGSDVRLLSFLEPEAKKVQGGVEIALIEEIDSTG
jgi:hypothetical protein